MNRTDDLRNDVSLCFLYFVIELFQSRATWFLNLPNNEVRNMTNDNLNVIYLQVKLCSI